jgi:hypothetical protein
LPRPDPLGHLSLRDRRGAGRRTRHRAPFSRSRPAHTLRSRLAGRPSRLTRGCRPAWPLHSPLSRGRQLEQAQRQPLAQLARTCPSRLRRTACTDQRRRGQGPPHPNLREEARDPLHPRCLPLMSYHPDRLRLSPVPVVQVGRSPQIVANLWKTLGTALRLLRTPTALTGRGRRNPRLRSTGTGSQPRTGRTGRQG